MKTVVKVRRYNGSESVVSIYEDAESAATHADRCNTEYQTDAYYTEPWDGEKAEEFFRESDLVLRAHLTKAPRPGC